MFWGDKHGDNQRTRGPHQKSRLQCAEESVTWVSSAYQGGRLHAGLPVQCDWQSGLFTQRNLSRTCVFMHSVKGDKSFQMNEFAQEGLFCLSNTLRKDIKACLTSPCHFSLSQNFFFPLPLWSFIELFCFLLCVSLQVRVLPSPPKAEMTDWWRTNQELPQSIKCIFLREIFTAI